MNRRDEVALEPQLTSFFYRLVKLIRVRLGIDNGIIVHAIGRQHDRIVLHEHFAYRSRKSRTISVIIDT
jgi:hypothetical protein